MEGPCRVYVEEVVLSTSSRFQLVDITGEIEDIVARSGVEEGICLIFAPHATAAIVVNEHEPGLLEDMVEAIKTLFPPNKPWRHNRIDDNAHAHLGSALMGSSRMLPVVRGRLVRGTWQNIFLVEMDGPRRRRRVVVEVMGIGRR